jgi:ACS family allantoate permease-like MFS transporter
MEAEKDSDMRVAVSTERDVIIHGTEINLDSKNVDEAMKVALESSEITLTPEESKRLCRKIDLYLMPFFVFLYAVQYMGKITNSFASVMGLRIDLHMTGYQCSWLGSAFYLGYLVFSIPVSLILQRFPVAKTTSVFILLWGIVVCLFPATNLPGFMFLRVVLGALEASITPEMVILTT